MFSPGDQIRRTSRCEYEGLAIPTPRQAIALKNSRTFLASNALWSASIAGRKRVTIVRQTFKLKTRGRAIFSENDYRNVILIPPSATVTLVGGDIDEDVFVKIRYEGRVLLILSEDLRAGGNVSERSA